MLLHTNTLRHKHFSQRWFCKEELFRRNRVYTHTDGCLYTELLLHILLYTNTFTHSFHQFFDAEILLPAGTFLHRDTLALHGDVFLHGEVAFTHTHARALAGMFLNARALTQRYFYTEMLWHRDAFTHRNACTYTHIHTHTFTQRWLYTEQLYTQNPLQKNRCVGAFY